MLDLITKTQNFVSDRKNFCKGEFGATSIQHGLIAAGVAIAIIAAIFALGDEVKEFFQDLKI